MPGSLFYWSSRLKPAIIKKRLKHSCFALNFVKLLRTSFLQNISGLRANDYEAGAKKICYLEAFPQI